MLVQGIFHFLTILCSLQRFLIVALLFRYKQFKNKEAQHPVHLITMKQKVHQREIWEVGQKTVINEWINCTKQSGGKGNYNSHLQPDKKRHAIEAAADLNSTRQVWTDTGPSKNLSTLSVWWHLTGRTQHHLLLTVDELNPNISKPMAIENIHKCVFLSKTSIDISQLS